MVDNINTGSFIDDQVELGRNTYGFSSGDDAASATAAAKEQDRLLPIANVGRIMKQILPPNAKISKEAKETIQECVSEFVSFVTGEASEKCRREKRKTLNGDDVCWALECLGFDDYAPPLKTYLNRYRLMDRERADQPKSDGNGYGRKPLADDDDGDYFRQL